jgi:site-specific recombinase XerC
MAACDGTSPGRLRDRAILLMWVRLGLRSGDVARLRLTGINWASGTLQVMGKGRYQVRLPLPQDVGDALLRYLEVRSSNIDNDHVFVRSIAPHRRLTSGDGVSSVVKHAFKRANIMLRLRVPTCCATQLLPRCCGMVCPWIRQDLFSVTAALM